MASVGKAEMPRKGTSLLKMYLERAGMGLFQNLRCVAHECTIGIPHHDPRKNNCFSRILHFCGIEVIYTLGKQSLFGTLRTWKFYPIMSGVISPLGFVTPSFVIGLFRASLPKGGGAWS